MAREVLVERYIPGRELTVGVLGDRPLAVTEIRARARLLRLSRQVHRQRGRASDPGAAAAGALRARPRAGAARASGARLPRRDPLRLPPRPGRSRRPLSARGQHPAGHDADLAGAGAGGPCRHRLRRSGRSSWWRRRDATHDARRAARAHLPAAAAAAALVAARRSMRRRRSLALLPGRRRSASGSAARASPAQAGERAHRPRPGADRRGSASPCARSTPTAACAPTRRRCARSSASRSASRSSAIDPDAARARLEQLPWVEQASVERMLPDQHPDPPDRAAAARAVAARRPLRPDRPRRRGDRTGRRARRMARPACRSEADPDPLGQLRVLVGEEAPRHAAAAVRAALDRARAVGRGWSPRPGSASGAGRSTSTTRSTCCCPSDNLLRAWRLLAAEGARRRAARARDLGDRPALPAGPAAAAARSRGACRTPRHERRQRGPPAVGSSRGRAAGTSRSACSTSARPRCAA